VVHLTLGNASDINAPAEVRGFDTRLRHLLADRGYDADALRRNLRVEARCRHPRPPHPVHTTAHAT
jgi:hypothetical protein